MMPVRGASSVASLCIPQMDSRDGTATDRWTSFLQCYDVFIARELAQQHPQFARSLRQLEHETRLEQERHSAQVLATLRVKDAKILELQKLLSEQREQLDVVLDELERRETTEDVGVQVEVEERHLEDVAMQTEDTDKMLINMETQTVEIGGQSDVVELLEKLEKELKTLEQKNLVLETQLQTRIPKKVKDEQETKEDERIELCLQKLQQGMDAMDLSCGCVDFPLAFYVGTGRNEDRKPGLVNMSTCVNLEHQLEAQATRLEHIQECFSMWRNAAVQFMKRSNEKEGESGQLIPPISSLVHSKEKSVTSEVDCGLALRGALYQIRRYIFEHHGGHYVRDQKMLKDMAKALAKGKSGAKVAAKMIQKWAGWEAKHLDEMRNLRQGFGEERAVAMSRRTALVKRIDELEQRELELLAQVNLLRKTIHVKDKTLTSISSPAKSSGLKLGTGKCTEIFEYPHLMLRLATAEQSLLVKDEQLTAANDTIRALSLCTSASVHPSRGNSLSFTDNDPVNCMNRLVMEMQSTSKQKLDHIRRREKDLVTVSQYFQMEKACLQFQSRLEAEKKRSAMLEAAKVVCEQERDELEMRVEKLETEFVLASVTREAMAIHQKDSADISEDPNIALFFALKRLQLVEDNRKILRERLRHFQQQVTLMTQQRVNDDGQIPVNDPVIGTGILECVANHHETCVGHFKRFCDRHQSLTSHQDGDEKPESDWETLFSHYEILWLSFHVLYTFLCQLTQFIPNDFPHEVAAEYDFMLRAFNCQPVPATVKPYRIQERLQSLELELSMKNEKILILQQQLLDYKERLSGCAYLSKCSGDNGDQLHERRQSPVNLVEHKGGAANSIELMQDVTRQDTKYTRDVSQLYEESHLIMASVKPQEPRKTSSNGSGHCSALDLSLDSESNKNSMKGREYSGERTVTELQECLEKCSYLASQNTKLTRRLRAEKETNKIFVKEQKELQSQLSAKSEANSELQQTLDKYHVREETSMLHRSSSVDASMAEDGAVEEIPSKRSNVYEQKQEVLREQITSREQENLTLVQSLCTIKEKYAQMEIIHEKELRVKAAEHAESMEKYMTNVNETLSRIESDKHRLEGENDKLRVKLQQFEENDTRQQLEQSQRSSKGTNTVHEEKFVDSTVHTEEKETLMARVQDLELQLVRERKLTEAMEQKKNLENQQEEHHENSVKIEASTVKQEYESRSQALQEWRSNLEKEFAAYQTAQRTSQEESDRRIEFLSACVEEFVRLANPISVTSSKTISTMELYDAVMTLARDPPQSSKRRIVSSRTKNQTKLTLNASRGQKTISSQEIDPVVQDCLWNDKLLSKKQEETEVNEIMWWKLRASKLEPYLRAAMLQNETFEDTIRKLELSMNDVKEELSTRLARETHLLSTLTSLKTELATTKDQTVCVAEKCQVATIELEKRQKEASSCCDETQRARMALQRKTELLSQQKAKVASLQQEFEQATKKLERLAFTEKQSVVLQQKAKEHTQQLLQTRQSYERCHDDNVQLSFHLEKAKERNAGIMMRLKAARAENTQLRAQLSTFKNKPQVELGDAEEDHRSNQTEMNAVSIASLSEETRALKRRVLQKQEVIVTYKAKLVNIESQLETQRETIVKLARTNRELQQGQRQRQHREQEFTSAIHAKLEAQFTLQQEQLDGLRASVYDSFEAFVFCRPSSMSKSSVSQFPELENPLTNEVPDENQLFEIKRWTDFSAQDLEELRLARGSKRSRQMDGNQEKHGKCNVVKRKAAAAALRSVEGALEVTPEDCRAEICELLQCLCGE